MVPLSSCPLVKYVAYFVQPLLFVIFSLKTNIEELKTGQHVDLFLSASVDGQPPHPLWKHSLGSIK